MKTLIIYTSQTGFTKKYAEWIAKQMRGELLTLKDAKKMKAEAFDTYDAIVYGGWTMAGSIVHAKWFMEKAIGWKDKKLAMFCVGASPKENPEVDEFLEKALTDEQRTYMNIFYCPGGLDYSKMKAPARLAMKAFASALKKKKDASQMDKDKAAMISHSYDISDMRYIEPIVEYFCD